MPTQRVLLDSDDFNTVFSLMLDEVHNLPEKLDVFVNGNEILGVVCLAYKDYLNEVHKGIKYHKQKNIEYRKSEDDVVKIKSLLNLSLVCTQAIASLYAKKSFTRQEIIDALNEIEQMLYFRLKQKGSGAYASSHEILGILAEEYMEFEAEVCLDVKSREAETFEERVLIDRDEKIKELKDIAVGALWGVASIKAGGIDW